MAVDVRGNVVSSSDITSAGVFKTKIARDGLVCYLDAAHQDSYGGSGTSWTDLSGNSNGVTIYGSPSWTSVGGRTAFNLTADGHYMSYGSFANSPTTVGTLEAWIYPAASEITGGDRGTIILLTGGSGMYLSWNKSNTYMSNYWYSHSPEGYHEQVYSSRGGWHHWCSVWDNKSVYQYADGVFGVVQGVSGTSSANGTLIIGRESSGRQFSGGIAIIRVYNRALEGAEVWENFQAERQRFGI